jgi:hypothetical protein
MCSNDLVWSLSDTDVKFGLRGKVMRWRYVDMSFTQNGIRMDKKQCLI